MQLVARGNSVYLKTTVICNCSVLQKCYEVRMSSENPVCECGILANVPKFLLICWADHLFRMVCNNRMGLSKWCIILLYVVLTSCPRVVAKIRSVGLFSMQSLERQPSI